jgi:hypothetical protein
MKLLLSMLIILMCVSTTEFSFGQNYPFLRKVQIDVKVTHDSLTSMFYYDYSLRNDAKNLGRIEELRMDASREPNSVYYDSVGLRFAGHDFTEHLFRKNYPALNAGTVLIGFQSLPKGWLALFGNEEVSIAKNRDFILPGDSVDGLVMMSKFLPGIRTCVVEPHFIVDQYFRSIDDPANTVTVEQIWAIKDSQNYYGVTVGPWAPPAKFDPLVFLDTLASFVYESHAEGWIRSNAGYEKYIQLLATAKVKLLEKDTRTAIRYLREVLADANADRSRALKPEAYALIRYNTEYFLEQLRMGKSGKE